MKCKKCNKCLIYYYTIIFDIEVILNDEIMCQNCGEINKIDQDEDLLKILEFKNNFGLFIHRYNFNLLKEEKRKYDNQMIENYIKNR